MDRGVPGRGGGPARQIPDRALLQALSQTRADRVLVVEDGRFVDQITDSDVVTALEVLQGLGAHRDVEVPDGYA